ncbi:guanine nucleotide binding protein, alpha subunit [Collybia nuda]|uniref:Guanine nucleotide binding protein, alpha subunit n=1 Tax=Collybia nuda TaxID=64659 RepID=A0A9P5YGH6_9AGAR|nr:guanine nucleotide binding protein, alpha subunit [Collybia nuda]
MPVATSTVQSPKTWLDDQEAYYDEEAERLSNVIDETLKQESLKRKEQSKREVKVLLLGQSESGKSTLHKQFQLLYASQALEIERPSWRTAVYLNVIRAVRAIFEGLDGGISQATEERSREPSISYDNGDDIVRLQARLLPLLAAEATIASELNGGFTGRASLYVRTGWQTWVSSGRPKGDSTTNTTSDITSMAVAILRHAQDDIEALWRNPLVCELAGLRKLGLEESAPFFLNNLSRILEDSYLPTIDDILNTRIQTLGVVEHILPLRRGSEEILWRMYDVGGARSQRNAWIPYFDDATAIIFLAPISAFDQHLEENPKVNRIEDSLQLFSAICSNKLLKGASLILLLNKVDVLKQKLESGTRVLKYIPSYGKRRNNYESVAEYFRVHFKQIHHRSDSGGRGLYTHFTTMVVWDMNALLFHLLMLE